MVKKRRRRTAAIKFRVALEALEGSKMLSQLSNEHEIHANQTGAWKRLLLEDGPRVFAASGALLAQCGFRGRVSVDVQERSDKEADPWA